MRGESWARVCVGVLLCGALVSAEPAQQCQKPTLPANIDMAPSLARVLRDLSDRSPTFKAQCERLARADNLRVTIRLNPSLPSRCRALTHIRRSGLMIYAEVHLPPGYALIELAAHEFEHLLEQIDGLNLRALSRTRGSGVFEVDRELFETERAIRAGRVVAGEARDAPRTPAAD